MPSSVVDLLAIALLVVVLRAGTATVLAVLLGAAVLVPGPLVVPHSGSSLLTVQHVLIAAALIRVLLLAGDGTLDRRVLRVTPVTAALGALIVLSFLIGAVFSADSGSFAGVSRLVDLLAQLAFLVVCLALIRHLDDPWRVARIAAGVLVASSAIAVIEHVTGGSWGHFLFSHLPSQAQTDAAYPLNVRDGQTRVRAGAEFALQFAWISACLSGLLVVTLARSGRRLLTAALMLLTAAGVYWSFSRSATVALVLLVPLLALLARERRLSAVALAALGIGGLLLAADPSVLAHVSAATDQGSITTRFDRLAPILGTVARHPFRGLGLGNLQRTGFATTDNAFLLEYVELGAIGVAALAALLVVVVGACWRALRQARPDDRPVAAACLVGVLAYLASAQTYDAFSLIQGALVLWFLAALGVAVAERGTGPVPFPHPSRRAVLATSLAGVTVGWLAYALAPVHIGGDLLFTTLPATSDAATYDPHNAGKQLLTTACDVAALEDTALRGASLDCRPNALAPGVGTLHVTGGSREEVQVATSAVVTAVRSQGQVAGFAAYPIDPAQSGRTTVWTTAPGWMPTFALGLLLLLPRRRRTARGAR